MSNLFVDKPVAARWWNFDPASDVGTTQRTAGTAQLGPATPAAQYSRSDVAQSWGRRLGQHLFVPGLPDVVHQRPGFFLVPHHL